MRFQFTRRHLEGREAMRQRLFEILPGFTSWVILIGLGALTCLNPIVASVAVIAFLLFWVLRLLYLTIFLILSYVRLSVEQKTDWMNRIRSLDALRDFPGRSVRSSSVIAERSSNVISDWYYRQDIARLIASGDKPIPSGSIYHLVLLPVIKEGRDILESGIESILLGGFPSKQILLAIALEERAESKIHDEMHALRDRYAREFFDMLIVTHPDGLAGEARVKGANVSYAAKAAGEHFHRKGIPFEHVIVSCFDADTQVSASYFSCLTYYFMVNPDRLRLSFQPIPVYQNNIWKVPGFARVIEMGSSFFQLIEATNPEKLVTFSSHSMSFKALVDVGYWPVDMISDDSAIYWKSLIHFDGKYRVVPIYSTVSMDVVDAGSWHKTFVGVYKQKRRWAWGVENFPIVMRGFLRNRKMRFYDRLRLGFKLFEGHVSWATLPFLLTFVGWLPAIFSGLEFSNTVLYFNAKRITEIVFTLSSLALLGTIVISLCLLPRKKETDSLLWRAVHSMEWLFVPLILIFFSALPALDAQTRLMFRKYMEFYVTDKRRG